MSTIIEMAKQCGAAVDQILYGRHDYVAMTAFELERFTEMIRADERDKCADICDNLELPQEYEFSGTESSVWDIGTTDCAIAIRARKP